MLTVSGMPNDSTDDRNKVRTRVVDRPLLRPGDFTLEELEEGLKYISDDGYARSGTIIRRDEEGVYLFGEDVVK